MKDRAISLIRSGDYSCVTVRENALSATLSARGIAPLISLCEREKLCGAFVADKIIGKAAAMLLTLGKASACFAQTASRDAVLWLESHGVPITYDECVEHIVNRRGDGLCPMEETVLEIFDENKAYKALKDKLLELSGGNKMIYRDFQGEKLSLLGFGTMRLPTVDGKIDEVQTQKMVDLAIESGVNYFDTAFPYHGGMSEIVVGKALSKYPRESYKLATKYPGHQIAETYNPAEIFEEQLKKCGVEYFDFYLLHNVYEKSIEVYKDSRWGIVDYFLEQKRLGRIRHLGFSSHGQLDNLREFLDLYGKHMEFCQIQMNYLDWTLQNAREKYALLCERGIPVWIMEPVRGGKLANLPKGADDRLKALRPDESAAAWGFRWLIGFDNIGMVLSGMSNLDQMKDNIKTFSGGTPLSGEENELLLDIAEGIKNSVPCTSCRYCCDGCPAGLDIPLLLSMYNEQKTAPATSVGMRIESLPAEKRPSACLNCGACTAICPQKIDIPKKLAELTNELAKAPSWADICLEREKARQALK